MKPQVNLVEAVTVGGMTTLKSPMELAVDRKEVAGFT